MSGAGWRAGLPPTGTGSCTVWPVLAAAPLTCSIGWGRGRYFPSRQGFLAPDHKLSQCQELQEEYLKCPVHQMAPYGPQDGQRTVVDSRCWQEGAEGQGRPDLRCPPWW